jgi:hypothetical protein
VLILCDGGCGIRLTGKPPRWHLRAVRSDRCGFFGWRSAISLGLLLCHLTRMHHDKPQFSLRHLALAVLDLHSAVPALAMPVTRRFGLGPPRLLDEQGQRGVLLPPGFEFLPDGTGTRD